MMALWSVVAAFGAYFCMYAFRKPFTAADYLETDCWGVDFKTVLVVTQVLGYATSKFIGIKVIAEMTPRWRALSILVLIGLAHLALLCFALIPPPYNAPALFVNGLMLGMVFGLVLGFLEGRCLTEALSAGLCASFILADGATKSIGAQLLLLGISPFWMPFAAGAVFVLPLLLFVGMLSRIPPPSHTDVTARSERVPMNADARAKFFRRYGWGLGALVAMYLMITVLRSMRADFAPEIWQGLGYTQQPSIFFISEIFVALGVVVVNGLSVLIRDNRRAFFLSLGVSAGGLILVGLSLGLNNFGAVNGFGFMVLVGLGLYLPYVAVHTTVFERLIAMTRDRGNIGYLLYLADAFGYLGYVVVLLTKTLARPEGNFLQFFMLACGVIAMLALVGVAFCWHFFRSYSIVAEQEATIRIAEVNG
ncbi:MAG TPA: DUF5690 family protein [Pirellulaceae bacterium]|nr:DUF5690 family protein [Pirellulaceae bacterium]